jgi:hypothetical protein
LDPLDYNFVDIPFASSIYIELHYDPICVSGKKNRDCFTVVVLHNNNPLKFDYCKQANSKRNSQSDTCTLDDFLAFYQSIKY